MPSMVEAILRIRIDQSQVKSDVEQGLAGVDATKAGRSSGKSYGDGFEGAAKDRLRDSTGKFIPDDDAKKSGSQRGSAFGSALKAGISKALSGFSLSKVFGGSGEGALDKGLLGGLLPGIQGLSAAKASVVGLAGSALAALPSVAALGAGFIGVVGAVETLKSGIKTLIGTKDAMGPLYAQAQQIKNAYTSVMATAAQSILGPLTRAFNQIPRLLNQLGPAISSVFKGAGTLIQPLLGGLDNLLKQVLPFLGQLFRATAPLVRPLLSALTSLVVNVLPALVSLVRAAKPAFDVLEQILGVLGSNIGKMLSGFAPVVKASSTILAALGGVLGALLPVVGKVASSLATMLAPVFI